MLFSSIPFLYYFLPAVVILHALVPKGLKNTVLLMFSLVFYAWGEPKFALLMMAAIVFFWFCGRMMERGSKKLWLIVSTAGGVVLLGIFKYADFFVSSFNAVTGLSLPLLKLALPIGISFYTFQCMSYTVDVYRGSVPAQRNLLTFGTYVCLFPQLIAGPIVRYADVAAELAERHADWEDFACGLRRFLIGLGKKVLLANQFGQLTALFRETGESSVLFAWMYAVGFMLQIYFDFSGYSDMAIGMGRIFGFHFIENFDYPYCSKSITEFWRRWHMSLGSWFRDYVYIPLGGNRVGKGRWVFNVLVVWMLTGLWHGAGWNFVLWGLLFAGLLLLEKWVLHLDRWPVFLRRGYVLLVVCLSFVLFNAESLPQAVTDISGMFGLTGLPLVTQESLYYLRGNGVLLGAGILGATPFVRDFLKKWENSKVLALLEPVVMGLLLLLCTAYLVDGSFNPFLYFRF